MFEISSLGKLFSTFSHSYYLGDTVDRLHWNFTAALFTLCALFVGAKQQFGQPIQCMLPTHLDRHSWTDYGQYHCLVQNTYRLTYNKTSPNASSRAELRSDADVNYYQWVPFFLTIQALCFAIPGWLWTTLQSKRMLDMQAAIREAISLKKTFNFEDRGKKQTNLIAYIAYGLKMKMNMTMFRTKWCKYRFDEVNGMSVSLYFVSKFLNVVNDMVQLYIIGRFFGFSWFPTKRPFTSSCFPLITFCNMGRQTAGKMEINMLQCVLMLNFINEKIFFMLWYWISLLFVLSLTNFMITFVQCVKPQCREILIKFYLQGGEMNDDDCFLLNDRRCLRIYAVEFLGLDGALLLRFIDNHAGVIVTRDITIGLWQYFCGFYRDSNFYTSRRTVTNVERSEITCPYSSPLSPTAYLNRMS